MSGRSRSITPPAPSTSSGGGGGCVKPMNNVPINKTRSSLNHHPEKRHHHHRVEFLPVNSKNRRGSSATTTTVTTIGSGTVGPELQPSSSSHKKLQNRDSVDRDRKQRLEMVAKERVRREATIKRVRKEKKAMLFSSLLAFFALFLWIAAVFTDHWFYVTQSQEMLEKAGNSSELIRSDEVFVSSNTGLWRTCDTFQEIQSGQQRQMCAYFSIFLSIRDEADGPDTLDEHVIAYTRAQICFAFISILLMSMTIIAAFYTFKNSRYVYKRLAACLYFMTTISVLVVLEVLVTSVNYAEGHRLYPPAALVQYGFSFYLGWSVFLVYLLNGCIFLILSRKRKFDEIEIDKDDELDIDGGFIVGR